MAFKKKWFSNEVVSSDGYSVRLLPRAAILYTAKRRIYVSAEMLAPKHTWALYPEDMRFDAPHGEKINDEEMRKLITGRIREVFNFLGYTLA